MIGARFVRRVNCTSSSEGTASFVCTVGRSVKSFVCRRKQAQLPKRARVGAEFRRTHSNLVRGKGRTSWDQPGELLQGRREGKNRRQKMGP